MTVIVSLSFPAKYQLIASYSLPLTNDPEPGPSAGQCRGACLWCVYVTSNDCSILMHNACILCNPKHKRVYIKLYKCALCMRAVHGTIRIRTLTNTKLQMENGGYFCAPASYLQLFCFLI